MFLEASKCPLLSPRPSHTHTHIHTHTHTQLRARGQVQSITSAPRAGSCRSQAVRALRSFENIRHDVLQAEGGRLSSPARKGVHEHPRPRAGPGASRSWAGQCPLSLRAWSALPGQPGAPREAGHCHLGEGKTYGPRTCSEVRNSLPRTRVLDSPQPGAALSKHGFTNLPIGAAFDAGVLSLLFYI